MQISDNDKKLLFQMQQESPEYYELFLHMKDLYAKQASTVTHDIFNYVTVLHGTLQIIETKSPDIARYQLWQNFNNSIHELIDYLNTTSQFRYASHCNMSEIDILDILWNIPTNIDDMFEELHLSYPRNYILDFPLELPPVTGDFERINDALLAITRNAVEATKEDDDIHICSKIENNKLTVTITDYGRGIPADIEDTMKIPFTSDKASHAGLGLAIADLVARQHGGSLEIIRLEKGTSVNFSISMDPLTYNNLWV